MKEILRAKHWGPCALGCGEPIQPGDDVTCEGDKLVHFNCEEVQR